MSIYTMPNCRASYTSNMLVKSSTVGSSLMINTYDTRHGNSSTFYADRAGITEFLCDPNRYSYAEFDIHNTIRIRKGNANDTSVELTWLHGSDDAISGYRQTFYTDADTLLDMCEDNSAEDHVRLMHTDSTNEKSHIILTPAAHKQLMKLSPMERHAFCKLLGKAFYYGNEATITIGADYGKDFWFNEEINGKRGISGGICMSKTTHKNHRGTYPAVKYSIHT